jgi:hypothetical protein
VIAARHADAGADEMADASEELRIAAPEPTRRIRNGPPQPAPVKSPIFRPGCSVAPRLAQHHHQH